MSLDEVIFFDAGLFIGALLSGDPRHQLSGFCRPVLKRDS